MELVALLSTGQGTWGQVAGLIQRGDWEKIVLVGNDFAKQFQSQKKADFVRIDFDAPISEIRKELIAKLKGKFSGLEVALSIASGTGKEHMAIISALMQVPIGIKFVVLTQEGIIEL